MSPDNRIKIASSILAADFSRLGEQVAEADQGGADYIHVDVMDGDFVPNLTIGPLVVKAIRAWTQKPLDVHMMVSWPERFLPQLAEAGADIITVHAEACSDLSEAVRGIKEAGLKAGVAISPATPVSVVEGVLQDLDLALVMTVNPGMGGQPFMESQVGKIVQMRAALDGGGHLAELVVDGGINPATARRVVEAGARVLVAGSAVYNSGTSVAEAIARIREGAMAR